MKEKSVRVWDPFVRIFHWSLVLFMTVNAIFTEGDSAIHHWIGYAVAALIAARIFWGFVGTPHARFSSFPPSIDASIDQLSDISVGRRKIHIGHTPLGALMIYNLLLTVLVITVSGFLMTTDAFWGTEWTEALHKGAVIWLGISAAVHVVAVMFESVRTKVNLPRAMITGYKHLP